MCGLMIFSLLVLILCILYGDAFICKKVVEKTERQMAMEKEYGWPSVPIPFVPNEFYRWPKGQEPQNHAYVEPEGYTEKEVKIIRMKMLTRLNTHRNLHKLKRFKINQRLNNSAQRWANMVASKNVLEHTPKASAIYGENLAGFMINDEKLASYVVDAWYSELKFFEKKMDENTFSKYTGIKTDKTDNKVIGHVTQLLWKPTHQVGIGVAVNRVTGEAFVVAHFYPSGNLVK